MIIMVTIPVVLFAEEGHEQLHPQEGVGVI